MSRCFVKSRVVFSMMGILLTFCCVQVVSAQVTQQDEVPTPESVQAMMEKAKAFTEPGENHKQLERLLGDWTIETRFVMNGQKTPPEKGTGSFKWLMEGRWITGDQKGIMMGKVVNGHMIMGYDNFKKSFVSTSVNDMDTAMLRSEGDFTRDGQTLIMYGTLNEYLTGEHDKMVKYIWRFKDEDHFVLEVHDLHIGEENTMVVEETYRRKK